MIDGCSFRDLSLQRHIQDYVKNLWGKFLAKKVKSLTAWKVSKYGVISGPYFPVFAMNTP